MKPVIKQVDDQVYIRVRRWLVRDQVRRQVWGKVYWQVWDQVKEQVWWQVKEQVEEDIT